MRSRILAASLLALAIAASAWAQGNPTAVNYTSVLSSKLFLEAQYSRKGMATDDTGAQFTDLVKGTLMFDRSRANARYNSPTFCAVCGNGWHEERNNWDWFATLGYFASTDKFGSHSLVMGFDNFKESRKVDNYQSGSGYRVYATKTYIADTPDKTIYPVIDGNSYIQYTPLVAPSVGSDIRTYSLFANDQWRYNGRLTFNIGFRFDKNNSKDQGGVPVLKDSQWSPRLGVSWDIKGNGSWVANTGYARYVMGVNGAVVDSGSQGGRTALYAWTYAGPGLNTTCTAPNCQKIADILPQVFAWFNTIGGINNTNYRGAPSIPGVTTKVSDGTTAPSSNEVTAALARGLHQNRGTLRVDYVFRTYADIYGSFVDLTTGTVADPTGRTYNKEIVKNTPDATRWYHAVTVAGDYRFSRVSLGGNYTFSYSKGNNDGENVGSGPIMSTINTYPEYKRESWSWPTGYMGNDQRHKTRLYASWLLPVSETLGQMTVGVIQRADTGLPYDIAFTVNPTAYLTNPGYVTAPTSLTYYIDNRGPLRTGNVYATDLSFVWTKKLKGSFEVFFRGLVYNIFNNQAVAGSGSVDTTVSSNASPGSYTAASLPAFNPYTTAPVYDVNYRYGPNFGKPTAPSSYQVPRSANFLVGVRF